jgi:hypothetical protein
MVLVYAGVYFKHEQIIRCNFDSELVERSGDVENGAVLEKSKGYTLGPYLSNIRHVPLRIETEISKHSL